MTTLTQGSRKFLDIVVQSLFPVTFKRFLPAFEL